MKKAQKHKKEKDNQGRFIFMKKRKVTALLSAVVLAAAAMMGCGSQNTTDTATETTADTAAEDTTEETQQAENTESHEPVQINYITWVQSADGEYPQNMISAFEEKYPWITVNFEKVTSNSADRLQTLKVRLLSGEDADVVTVTPGDFNELMGAGYVQDITGAECLQNYAQEDVDAVTVDGKTYGIPYAKDVIGVMYNKTMFEENGWEVPTNKQEWLALCDTIADAGITPMINGIKDGWPVNDEIAPFIHGLYVKNPDIFEQINAGEKKYTDQEFVDCFTEIANYFASKAVTPEAIGMSYDQSLTYFATGKSAMICHGEWAMGSIKQAEPNFEIGVFQIPYNDAGEKQIGSAEVGQFQIMTTIAKDQEACQLFLDYMSSEEGSQFFTASMGNFSAVQGAQTPGMEMWDSVLNDYEVMPFFYDQMYAGAKTEMYSQMQLLFTGDTTVKKALEAMQAAQNKK